jgi:hypothetical protein
MGTGEIALYKCMFELTPTLSWWRLVEVLDYRKYETEGKLNDCVLKMQGLYAKHNDQFDAVLEAKQVIKDTRTIDPFRSGMFEASLPKDSCKYRKARAQPVNLWEGLRKIVKKARAHNVSVGDSSHVDAEGTAELMGVHDQKVGIPIRDNNQLTKAQRRQANQSNQQ